MYKIDTNGTIAWRLGGINNDFEKDFDIVRQHHALVQSHNSTHTVISVLDNAMSEDNTQHSVDYSRGLLVALQFDVHPMKATVLAEYPHPNRIHIPGRGSMQVLDTGNVFCGWVNWCQHAEYASDGTLVMEAHTRQE